MIKFIRDFRGRVTKEAFYPIGFTGEFEDDIEDRLVNDEKCAKFVKEKKSKVEEVEKND